MVASILRCLLVTDYSEDYAKQLLQPALDSPPGLADLERFITEPPSALIPICAEWLEASQLTCTRRLRFVAASGRLARAVSASLSLTLPLGDSEQWTVLTEHLVVVAVLQELDKALPPDLRIGYGRVRFCATVLEACVVL